MSVFYWLISILCFFIGCIFFREATLSKEELTCSEDWTYSLTQLGLAILAMGFWLMSLFIRL